MAAEAKVKAKEEVVILVEEGVDSTTKIHTNLRECILNLLPKLESIPMAVGSSSVTNRILQ